MTSKEPAHPTEIARSICKAEALDLDRELGSGAFKSVYLVSLPDNTPAALKVVRSPSASPRVSREVSAGRRADHPSIARIFQVGECEFDGDRYAYYLEEYLEGGSLADLLERDRDLGSEQVTAIGGKLLDALEHLDSLSLVHRDIKPANIMFREQGTTPVLVDFGLVRDIDASSLTPSWLDRGPGSPYFAAPEQLNNEKYLIDWRSDQFSLGVVLCIARFSFHPFQRSSEELFDAQTVERVAQRGRRREGFDDLCSETGLSCVGRMTEAWPARRYRSPGNALSAWATQGK